TGDEQWSIGRESGGDHGSAGEPPGNVASRDEIIFRTLTGAAAEIKSEQKRDHQIADNCGPVEQSKCHRSEFIAHLLGAAQREIAFGEILASRNLARGFEICTILCRVQKLFLRAKLL